MPKLKVLSGEDVVKIFGYFGFFAVGQKGNHVKLKRKTSEGISQTLTIPKHKELDKGTLKAIYNQGLRFISEEKLLGYFFHE